MYEHAQEELPPTIDEEEFQECQEFNTNQDLEPPTDDLLDFITSQEHSDDQLDQVLQTYQAYQHPSMNEDLAQLPHATVTSDDIWDPTVLDHFIDIENDIYHPAMDSNINDEDFTSFDECTSVTGSYLHHDGYGPDYVCDV